jgi:peptide/nickel transport system permease protein
MSDERDPVSPQSPQPAPGPANPADVSQGATLAVPVTSLTADANPAPQGYWALTWQQFRKRKEAYIALYVLGALFLMALVAPLIANNLPWYVSGPQASGYPLIRDFFAPLSHLDRFYNSVFMTLLLIWLAPLIGRLFVKADAITWSDQWWKGAIVLFVSIFAASVFYGGTNDTTDYKALKQAGQHSVVFTFIPYGPLEDNSRLQDKPPSEPHVWGNDNNGFDVLTRIIHGSRISLAVGFLAIGLAVAIGIVCGSLAGYFGGWIDLIISRVIEVFICFPSFFLILTIIAIAPRRSIFWVMFAIGLTGWMGIARLIRGEVLKVRQLDYIQAARALGASDRRIIFRQILPNALAPVLVAATFGVAGAILSESSLGFLGLGVEPPTPSWGELLNQARQDPVRLWWLMTYPGLMIFLSVTLMNLVGEGLRDAMDPKMRR